MRYFDLPERERRADRVGRAGQPGRRRPACATATSSSAGTNSPIASIDQLHRLLTEEQVGQPHLVTALRGREQITATVTPTEAPRR